MNIKSLVLFLLILGCTNTPKKKINLELELNKILEGQTKEVVERMNFLSFTIDWENPIKWESNCASYLVLPKKDTFNNNYSVDFCYDKYRWWDWNKK